MAFLLNQYLPPPHNVDLFIHLCADLYAHVFNDASIHRHSLHGESRYDIDLWGYEDGAGELFGIHCAFCDLDGSAVPDKSTLQAIINAAWDFRPVLNHLVIVTNIANDEVVQDVWRKVKALTAKRPYFRCDVVGWLEVQRLVGTEQSLLEKYYPAALHDAEDLSPVSDTGAHDEQDAAVLPTLSTLLHQFHDKEHPPESDPFEGLSNVIGDACPGCGAAVADWVVVCPCCGAHIVRGATPEELLSLSTVVFFLTLMVLVAAGHHITAVLPIFSGWTAALILSAVCGGVAYLIALLIGRHSRRVRGADYHSSAEHVRPDEEGDTPFPPSSF